jgi:hypothetical protein
MPGIYPKYYLYLNLVTNQKEMVTVYLFSNVSVADPDPFVSGKFF